MASSAATGACTECQRLRSEYRQATAARMQAEADYLVAVHSRNSRAIQGACRTVRLAVTEWTRANQALRQHQKVHLAAA